MPNHVKTIVRMTGAREEIQKLFETCVVIPEDSEKKDNLEKTFDFNTIIAMPDHIYRGSFGANEEKIYGKNNWYDWSVENWGTKWNAYSYYKISDNKFTFQTAWALAEPVLLKLSSMFPNIKFHVRYADEDVYSDNCGKFVMEKGESFERDVANRVSFARSVWRND